MSIRSTWTFWIMTLCMTHSLSAQLVPNRVTYCGIDLHLSNDAKQKIGEYVSQIYSSPLHFKTVIQRAELYMSFVEDAFRQERVPQDLKYLVIQESTFKGDAVSSSNAVGFWQFKAGAAREMGLVVNDQRDDRMHISKASRAAAAYLAKANLDFDNWVYAVIAYYQGPTGAVPHTNPDFYGKKIMHITAELHWYALKAIAHKLAFEKAIGMIARPEMTLAAHTTSGLTTVKKLCQNHQISEADFALYNKWTLGNKRFDKTETYTYFIPQRQISPSLASTQPQIPVIATPKKQAISSSGPTTNDSGIPVKTNQAQPVKKSNQETKGSISQQTQPIRQLAPQAYSPYAALPKNVLIDGEYADFELLYDLHYGTEYIVFDGQRDMFEIASDYNLAIMDLLQWNFLPPGTSPYAGKIIYLESPENRRFHIVEKGEDLARIASMLGTNVNQLKNRNNIPSKSFKIYEGQKLYVSKRKPPREKMIILSTEISDQDELLADNDVIVSKEEAVVLPAKDEEKVAPKPLVVEKVKPSDSPVTTEEDVMDVQSKWVSHKVMSGETLWSLAKRYNTKVEVIKIINKLDTETIQAGQNLRILSRTGVE